MSDFDDFDLVEDLAEDVDEAIARCEVKGLMDKVFVKKSLSRTDKVLSFVLFLAIFLFCLACGFQAI